MMSVVAMVVMVALVDISATLGLERRLYVRKLGAEAPEHMLDHMVGPNAENLVPNFGWQMPVSQVPSQARKLIGIFVPNFDDMLRSSSNKQPPPIVKLQTISISHRNGFRKVEKDLFASV